MISIDKGRLQHLLRGGFCVFQTHASAAEVKSSGRLDFSIQAE